MSTPKLKWHRGKVAAKWPEGSIILIHRPMRGREWSGYMDLCTWFRPDWILSQYTHDLEIEKGHPTLFALIERRVIKKKREPKCQAWPRCACIFRGTAKDCRIKGYP